MKRGWRVCDLGTGAARLLLMLAARGGGLHGSGAEEWAAQCARENLAHSGLEGTVLQGGLAAGDSPGGGADLVISNPPASSLDTAGTGARGLAGRLLLEELRTAARLLRNRGRFCPVPPAGAAGGPDVRPAGERGLEPKRMRLLA